MKWNGTKNWIQILKNWSYIALDCELHQFMKKRETESETKKKNFFFIFQTYQCANYDYFF